VLRGAITKYVDLFGSCMDVFNYDTCKTANIEINSFFLNARLFTFFMNFFILLKYKSLTALHRIHSPISSFVPFKSLLTICKLCSEFVMFKFMITCNLLSLSAASTGMHVDASCTQEIPVEIVAD
jgi:hypothetical protein